MGCGVFNILSQRMVATSLADPKVASSPGLYARIRQGLQPKLPADDAHASIPNEDSSHSRQGSTKPQETGSVCLFPINMYQVMMSYFLLGRTSERWI